MTVYTPTVFSNGSSPALSASNLNKNENALSDAHTELQAHLDVAVDAHDASAISNVVAGNLVATTVQAAINELDNEKVAKAGDTMTGTLNLPANGLVIGTNQLVASGGNVGIGTASLGDTLTVEGNINLGASGHRIGFNQNVYSPVTGAYSIGVVASGNFPFRITGADDAGTNRPFQIGYYSGDNVANTFNVAMHVNTHNGNVGIGTESPAQLLSVGANSEFNVRTTGVMFPVQAPTASAPSYVKGGVYFDTTLNKLRVGGATAWETVTSV